MRDDYKVQQWYVDIESDYVENQIFEYLRKAQQKQTEAGAAPDAALESRVEDNWFELNGEIFHFYKKLPGHKICAFGRNGSDQEDNGKPKQHGAFVGITDFTLIIVTWNAEKNDSKGR